MKEKKGSNNQEDETLYCKLMPTLKCNNCKVCLKLKIRESLIANDYDEYLFIVGVFDRLPI